MPGNITETVFNTDLGHVLRTKHPRWRDRIHVEKTNIFEEGAGLRPDLVIDHPNGIPVVVETEFAPANTVENDALSRLGKTMKSDGRRVEQVIALRVPETIVRAEQQMLQCVIESAELEYCLFSETTDSHARWPSRSWVSGDVNDLASGIELASLSEDRVSKGLDVLENAISQTASSLRKENDDVLNKIASALHQKDCEQTSRMAMAILVNAFTFHMAISRSPPPPPPPPPPHANTQHITHIDELLDNNGRLQKTALLVYWTFIFEKINYWPIFKIATEILRPIPAARSRDILERLHNAAVELDELGATSHHDLCGRMLQRLISDRKFLATFYTLPSSAALLAELAVPMLEIDWSDPEALKELRIADFACGTGALLNAAYESVAYRHRIHGGDDTSIHAKMIEDTLVGTDIMPAATHLTATILSSTHPGVTFGKTSIITLPYGKPDPKSSHVDIGALELIESQRQYSIFDLGHKSLRGVGEVENSGHVDIPHNTFDLVIMNPPFTRPTISTPRSSNLSVPPIPSFAGMNTSEVEQKLMSRRLRSMHHESQAGHGNAGLASNFMDIAHAKVKDGGIVAFVLPATILSGKSWENARKLLAKNYREITIVSIVTEGSENCAFSADTGMAEVLVVATRKPDSCESENHAVRYINLSRRPNTILEAQLTANTVNKIPNDQNYAIIGDEQVLIHHGTINDGGVAGVKEVNVVAFAAGLSQSMLWLPRNCKIEKMPIVNLGDLGRHGCVHRDINGNGNNEQTDLPRGPFDILEIQPGEILTWPALWNHNAKRETKLIVEPDTKGQVRPRCDEKAREIWNLTASRLNFNQDFRLNSQPLAACMTWEPVLGGSAWANFKLDRREWEHLVTLWANTTLGLITFWWIGSRQQQGRSRVSITRIPEILTIDAREFSNSQLNHSHTIFNDFMDREFLPANEAWNDQTRIDLDRAILIDLLELNEEIIEPLALLRRQWCAEPSVHGGKPTRP